MKSTRKELVQASLDKIFIEKRCLIRQLLADLTPSESYWESGQVESSPFEKIGRSGEDLFFMPRVSNTSTDGGSDTLSNFNKQSSRDKSKQIEFSVGRFDTL